MFHKFKITVVRIGFNEDLINEYASDPKSVTPCPALKENQEFILTSPYEVPEGMCAWAWADLRPYIFAIATGGSFDFQKDKDTVLACCSDTYRPVTFKIERIPE